MKLEIYEPPEDAPEVESIVRLRLKSGKSNGVDLIAVDEDGEVLSQGRLCRIDNHGIRRAHCVDEDLGFDLDVDGRLVDLGM